jgi:response regulator NasT
MLEALRIALLENGFNLVAVLPADTFLQERLAQLQVDLIILDAESEARDALEHVVVATRDARRPILNVVIARFEHEEALHTELADAKAELLDLSAELKNRRIIDRAKGLLMQRQGLSERVAYDKLRKTALDKNLKVVDVAQRMLDVAELLGCSAACYFWIKWATRASKPQIHRLRQGKHTVDTHARHGGYGLRTQAGTIPAILRNHIVGTHHLLSRRKYRNCT